MNGDITLEALRRCQRASKVISPFIIFIYYIGPPQTKKVKGPSPPPGSDAYGYRGNRPTNKHTDRGDYNTLRR